MRFERIRLTDYRGIRSVEFRPRPAGITIVEGENEAGKSSIAEALWLIFEQHDDSSSKLVASLKPAGRDAATEIEVEVTTGDYRFTYFKRFHRSPRTELRVEAPRRERLAGREADARARQILDETIDRQLWGALRVQQGQSLDPIDAGSHQSLLSALEVAAGQVMGGDRESSIYERARQEYERYFTATGRERAGGDTETLPKLRTARDHAMDDATQLSQRISSMEERANQAAAFERELTQLRAQIEAARSREGDLTAAEAARREQQAVVDGFAVELRLQDSALTAAEASLEARTRDVDSLGALRGLLQEANARLSALGVPLEEATSTKARATGDLDRALQGSAEAGAARQRAEEHLHLAQAEFTAETMTERLERLERHEPELAELNAWLAGCGIDRGLVQKLAEAESRLEQVRARKDAEGAIVEIAAPDGLDLEIGGRPVRVEPGTPRRGTVLGESVMTLPGGVTITIRAGAGAREAGAEFASVEAAMNKALASARVQSVAAASELLEERIAREERRRGLREQMANDLRDLASAQELREKLGRERARIAALRHNLGAAEQKTTIDAAKAALDAANRAATEAETSVAAQRAALANAESTVVRLERERDQLGERIRTLNEDIGRREAELEAARAGQPEQALEDSVRELQAKRTATHTSLSEASAKLAELPDGSAALAQATAEVQECEGRLSRVSVELARLRGVLEDAGAEGLHARLQEAEQRLDAAQESLDSFERRANAAKLLFETLRRHRDRARENYAQPLRERINELGRLMFGPTFSVELSEDLKVVRRSLDGIDLPIDQLSVGFREQLAVVTRLACASLVSKNGGAPLVLDDILGWSDPARLQKFAELLPVAAGDAQVLVFTCSPERFAGVAPARVVSMGTGRATERGSAAPIGEGATSSPAVSAHGPARRTPERPAAQTTFDLFEAPEPEALAR